ncbi:MAG: hypothetical protein JOY80_07880 [Candidatus Dormibacteraeota bacterium]|nr:hypothetical protein [Candidatus Dormibacteraeota bacterium]
MAALLAPVLADAPNPKYCPNMQCAYYQAHGGVPGWAIAIIVIAVVAAVAALLTIVLARRRRTGTPPSG